MLTDSNRKYLCRAEGLYGQTQYLSFAAVLCLTPENGLRAPVKIAGSGLAAGCQLFYRKIYGCFLQCV